MPLIRRTFIALSGGTAGGCAVRIAALSQTITQGATGSSDRALLPAFQPTCLICANLGFFENG
jgi:hypothetical protein